MEIAAGVHRIKCEFGANRMVYVHLLVGTERAMLIDTGIAHNPSQDILPYMDSINFDPARLTYMVMSHSDLDHQGGNIPMKEAAPNVLLAGHRLDRHWLDSADNLINGRYSQFEADHGIGYGDEAKAGIKADCLSYPLDFTLSGGETFRLSPDWYVEAVHTPGHTWGHLAIYDPRSKLLVSGEAALWNAILDDNWQPAMPPTYCYVDTYLATQNKLLAMDIDIMLPAHWPVQKGQDVKDFVHESRNYCLLVEQKLLDLARDKGEYTLREAIDTLGMQLGDWPEDTNQDFSYGMAGNLESLTKRGILTTGRNQDGWVTWRLAD